MNVTFGVFHTSKTRCWLAKWIENLHWQGCSQIDEFDQIVVLEVCARGDIRCKPHRIVVPAADRGSTALSRCGTPLKRPACRVPLSRLSCKGRRLMAAPGKDVDEAVRAVGLSWSPVEAIHPPPNYDEYLSSAEAAQIHEQFRANPFEPGG